MTYEVIMAKRKFERSDLRLDTPALNTRTGRFISGQSENLSTDGIFVETTELPDVGEELQFFIGGLVGGAQAFGRVVHVVPGKGFGARFTSGSDEIAALLG